MTDGKNAPRGAPPPPQTAGADARAGKSPTQGKGAGAGSTANGTDDGTDDAPKRRHENWGARSVECYEKLEQVGEGTYGQVYMARCKETNDIVALKKIELQRKGRVPNHRHSRDKNSEKAATSKRDRSQGNRHVQGERVEWTQG